VLIDNGDSDRVHARHDAAFVEGKTVLAGAFDKLAQVPGGKALEILQPRLVALERLVDDIVRKCRKLCETAVTNPERPTIANR